MYSSANKKITYTAVINPDGVGKPSDNTQQTELLIAVGRICVRQKNEPLP